MIPLHDRVVLKQLETPRDGLWLPDEAGFMQHGIVLEIGAECHYCRKGDLVMFKTDEALRLRVPVESGAPKNEFAKLGIGYVTPAGDEWPPMVSEGPNEETVFLVSEGFIYLILDRSNDDT